MKRIGLIPLAILLMAFPLYSQNALITNTRIAFGSYRGGNLEIFVMNGDGSNQTNLTNNPAADEYPSWSPLLLDVE